jgi:hypothetical protein
MSAIKDESILRSLKDAIVVHESNRSLDMPDEEISEQISD